MNTPNVNLNWNTNMHAFRVDIMNHLLDPNFYFSIIKVIFLLIIAKLMLRYGTRALEKIMTHQRSPLDIRRKKTLGSLGVNILRYSIYFIVFLLVLEQFGFPIQTLLAGASVIGIALGFGAQSLVKDIISGFFVILEDQYGVGDEIQVGSYRGVVHEMGLRTTVIKSFSGEIHILPNGTITQVTNYSKANSVATIDVDVSYEQDIERVIGLIQQELDLNAGEIEYLVGKPQVLGIQELGETAVKLRITADCAPLKHYSVGRELRLRIKSLFDREKIMLPYKKKLTLEGKEVISVQNSGG